MKKKEIATAPAEIKIEKDEIPVPLILKKKSPVEQPVSEEHPNKLVIPPAEETIWDIPLKILEEPVVEIVEVVEEEMILPAEAVEILTDSANAEPSDDKLKIELFNEEKSFKGGERKTLSLIVRRGTRETGLSGVQILVKIIGSSFRPLIFHAKTDSNGAATVHLQLPHFRAGRAAILVRAISEGEETELRRIIRQG